MQGLTERERGILELVAHGQTSKEIAHSLGIATQTVKLHVVHAARKLGAKNRAEAVAIALARHYIESLPEA